MPGNNKGGKAMQEPKQKDYDPTLCRHKNPTYCKECGRCLACEGKSEREKGVCRICEGKSLTE